MSQCSEGEVAQQVCPAVGVGPSAESFLPEQESNPLPADAAREPPAGTLWQCPITGMVFVWVPGGSFLMGSNQSDASSDERPVHKVTLNGFWIGKYPLTQGEWIKLMPNNTAYFPEEQRSLFGFGKRRPGNWAQYPMENISWVDVRHYLAELNARGDGKYRMPTEAEWEYACRSGGKNEKYSGGDDIDRVAWYKDNSDNTTHPVGQKDPNGLGLHDMSGNLWEWVADWYDENYYAKSPAENPPGAAWGFNRVVRGGCWGVLPALVRCSFRSYDDKNYRYYAVGARLARSFP
ncbi:MAG: formylglycine-generating enzyme family protein [Magnetococcales bacterium]|nr:formylglycine-generating enzyme family protein [Magnetococcales bacterium]